MEIRQIGNIMAGASAWDNPSTGRVYDQKGLAPTLNSGGRLSATVYHSGGKK